MTQLAPFEWRMAGAPERPAGMPLDRLLRLLVCPACREAVQPDPAMAKLLCPRCRQDYPIVEGVPVLLTDASRALLSAGMERTPPRAAAQPVWRAGIRTLLQAVSPGGTGRDPGQDTRIRRMIAELGDGAAILDLGSGGRWWGPTVIPMDIDRFPNVGLVGDGHRLPFRDSSLEGVICTRVLEHVQDAEAVTREIWRVIRPGGSCLYLDPVHPGVSPGHRDPHGLSPADPYRPAAAPVRLRADGLRRLGGPSAALAWILQEYLALLLFDGGRGYLAAYLVAGWLTCWMPLLDRVLSRRDKAHRIACGFYLLGRKPTGVLPDPAGYAA